MDLGIKELGITLIVGVFTLLGAEVIARYLFNTPLITFFHDMFRGNKPSAADTPDPLASKDEHKDDTPDLSASKDEHKDGKEATVTVAVFVAIVFAVGMMVETLSFKYVDDQNLWPKKLPAWLMGEQLTRTIGMPSKDDDRVAALIRSLDNPYPSPLAIDLAHSNAFLISDNSKTGERVQEWIKNSNRGNLDTNGAPSRTDAVSSIANLYYYAKNMAYSHENHYHELSQIQARLEFARSLAVLGFLCLVVVTVFAGVQIVRVIFRKAFKRPKPTAFLAAVFFGVYLFGLWTYARETEAFNRRAFGYLSSHLVQERLAAEQAVKLEAAKESAVQAVKLQAAKQSAVAAPAGPVAR